MFYVLWGRSQGKQQTYNSHNTEKELPMLHLAKCFLRMECSTIQQDAALAALSYIMSSVCLLFTLRSSPQNKTFATIINQSCKILNVTLLCC